MLVSSISFSLNSRLLPFRYVNSALELCDQVGKLKELMSGLGQMVVLVSMLLDSSVVVKNAVTNLNGIGLLDELVWWLWGSSNFTILLDSYSVSVCSEFNGNVTFRSEFNYMLSCFMLMYKITFISKCFYDALIVNEIGCLVDMIGRVLSNVQVYWYMNLLSNIFRTVHSGFDVSCTSLNMLRSVLSIDSVINKFLFDVVSVFRLSDEYYVLRFYLKGWLNWSEFTCWVANDINYFYLHSMFCYGFTLMLNLVFTILHYLVDYIKKVTVTVFNLGLGAVCNIWVSSFIFKGFAYELSTMDLWVLLFLTIAVRSIRAFSFSWS